jgi:L-alanine-DL-glutamate epimerase-like enolase superfamily enzyme
MKLRTEVLDLHTIFEFRIAHGARRAHRNTLVRIEHDGIEGVGEAAPSHYYGETPETIDAALAAWAPELGGDPFALDAIEARLDGALQGHGAARAGLEMALHDWIGKKLGQPTWKLLGLDAARAPKSCVTLGMASPEEMEKKLDTVRDFPLIKVKLGGPGDVDNLRRIRAGYKGKLQVDANTAWNAADAVRVLRQIEPLGIELVEQPVPRGDLDGLRWVRERSPIPVFADESAHTLADIAQLAGRVDGVNLKIMKTGGLREMQRMIHAARAHGMKVMLGSMIESSLALSAAAQLAPLVDYLDLDGHWLLQDDPFAGAPGERGDIRLSERPGLGVVPAGAAVPGTAAR